MHYQEILQQLSSNKCKITPQRKEIIKTLIHAKTHLSAKSIFNRMRKNNLQLSFDTVYRNLAILKDLGIVNQLDFQNGRSHYEINRKHGHHHYLVCLKCGGTWKLAGCPVDSFDVQKVPTGFKVTSHRFELFGYCQKCQDG